MKYIIFDLEATCWEGPAEGKNETIEIGAVAYNENQEKLGEFEQFIKPITAPVLSDFCTQLTSITQAQLDGAPHFPEAIAGFREWIGTEDYLLCSWGFYDRIQFLNDCRLHNLESDWVLKHISLKHQYTGIVCTRRHMGMKQALQSEGIALEGTHHRGIDDARNISKIFLKYFEDWDKTPTVK